MKPWLVRSIMKKELGLKYKPTKHCEVQANSERCLVLRQQYALKMLSLLAEGKRIYNIDESWVDQLNYTRSHWQPKEHPSSSLKPVSPRISLIACIGSDGSSLLSMTQVNTDCDVFNVYMTWLVRRLDAQDKNWRDNSVILLDNAPYHVSNASLSHLAFLDVPVILSGPYSYSTAPCELYFAHFKRG